MSIDLLRCELGEPQGVVGRARSRQHSRMAKTTTFKD